MPYFRLSLLRWFDSWAGYDKEPAETDDRIDWIRIVPFIFVHLGCIGVTVVEISWTAVYACLAMYFTRMFAITAFYHRYFSHRSFTMRRGVQFMAALLGSTAAQRGPLWWAANHRHHHRHSDTPDDPHSPRQGGFWHSQLGWIVMKRNFRTRKDLVKDLMRYPELIFLDRFDWIVPLLTGGAVFGLGHWLAVSAPSLGTDGPQLLVWGFFVPTVALFHATSAVNSIAHTFGNRRYPNPDNSRNNWMLAVIALGEGWHNNHHRFPTCAKQGIAWWEIDVTYYLIRVMACSGLVSGVRVKPDRRPS